MKVQWTDGSVTWEPLALMIAQDPVTLAVYAKEHNLLETTGWKKLNRYARRAKKVTKCKSCLCVREDLMKEGFD